MRELPTEYDGESFWRKVRTAARRAGSRVIERALVLYYCLQDNDTPRWARRVIIGALAYFILPVDLVPDIVPFAGYTDDLGVLVAAVASVATHVKDAHRIAARDKLVRWFGAAIAEES